MQQVIKAVDQQDQQGPKRALSLYMTLKRKLKSEKETNYKLNNGYTRKYR